MARPAMYAIRLAVENAVLGLLGSGVFVFSNRNEHRKTDSRTGKRELRKPEEDGGRERASWKMTRGK